jgi:gas vesicle protein
MENVFRKGLILGSVLAAAAVVGFAFTKEGQELGEEIKKDFKPLARYLKRRLSKLQNVTEEKYYELVDIVVEEYAKKKELAVDSKKMLTAALRAKWHEMEKEYLS